MAEQQKFVGTLKAFSKLNKFQTGIISLLSNLTASEKDLHELKKRFEDLDQDHDGQLQVEEFKNGLEQIIHNDSKTVCSKHPPDEYKKLMESMDKNGDGIITWDEFVAAAIDKVALLNKQNIRAAFEVLDENGDGRITKEELQNKFEGGSIENPEEVMWEEIIKEACKDGCGSITWNEFKTCMNKVLKQKLGRLHDH